MIDQVSTTGLARTDESLFGFFRIQAALPQAVLEKIRI
jgi:hypothetical protein